MRSVLTTLCVLVVCVACDEKAEETTSKTSESSLGQVSAACGKDADCAQGLTCVGTKKVPFRCVHPQSAICRTEPACTREGRCTARDGECVVASALDCAHTTRCAQQKCIVSGGRCVVQPDTSETALGSSGIAKPSQNPKGA